MFSAIVAEKRVGFCETTVIKVRSVGVWMCLRSLPEKAIAAVGLLVCGVVYRLSRREAIVDLPDPEDPTMAVDVPALI